MPEIQKVRYTHDALIDMVLAQPTLSQGQLAAIFGYTQSWLSIIMNSDAVRERMEARRKEVVDPVLLATTRDRLEALAQKSAEVLLEKMAVSADGNLAVKVLDVTSRALGYGARPAGAQVQVNVAPVAVVPAKELSSGSWMESYAPVRAPLTIDHQPAD